MLLFLYLYNKYFKSNEIEKYSNFSKCLRISYFGTIESFYKIKTYKSNNAKENKFKSTYLNLQLNRFH